MQIPYSWTLSTMPSQPQAEQKRDSINVPLFNTSRGVAMLWEAHVHHSPSFDPRWPPRAGVSHPRSSGDRGWLLRFGEVCCFPAGDALAELGKIGRGLIVVLAGEVAVTRRDQLGDTGLIITHHSGSFMGELAQLAGRPSLVMPVRPRWSAP